MRRSTVGKPAVALIAGVLVVALAYAALLFDTWLHALVVRAAVPPPVQRIEVYHLPPYLLRHPVDATQMRPLVFVNGGLMEPVEDYVVQKNIVTFTKQPVGINANVTVIYWSRQ